MKSDKARPVVGIVLSILCVLVVVGITTFAGPCGVHDDGSVGSCHWAARAVLGVGVVALVLALVRIFERDEGERRGLDLGVAAAGVLVVFLPAGLIDLCMMQAMRCHTIMHPFCMGVGAAIALVGAGDLAYRLLSLRKSHDA